MIIAGQDCKDRIQSVVWTSFQHPVHSKQEQQCTGGISRRAAKLPVASSEDLSTTRVHGLHTNSLKKS